MRKATILTFLLTIATAVPTFAIEQHQSFLSYDDGGTVVRQGDDGREIEARVNLPVYPGDEVITSRRGRAEVSLSDGNTLGIDRATAVKLTSILDSYEGEDEQTVVELRYGKVALLRTDLGRDLVRLDTQNASYLANREGIYSVESDAQGRDRVAVFEGSLEIRTPSRTSRIRAGESATVDDRGVYDLISDSRTGADDFERWFLRRAERFGSNNRYINDRRLSYWADDLDSHGRWVSVAGIGWSWRPTVAVGWRPYYNGYWSHRHGCLTWVSYDPWGWVPYHYGRWAYDPGYGWVWVPGLGYSPAWVYWWYGDSYVGWAPAGWWDCHRGYYDWAYRPYYRSRHDFGFGFNGRVRINEMDLRPWTFVDGGTLISNRIDRAALTTDAVKQRLGRGRDGYATISGSPARFTREEFRDPAAAIRRRGLDGGRTGRETGAPPTDVTPFFRRDPEVGATVRDRIVRGRGGNAPVAGGTGSVPSRGGSVAPIGSGGLAPIGRGNVAPISGGNVAPIGGGNVAPIGRGNTDATPDTPAQTRPRVITIPDRGRDTETPANGDSGGSSTWRDRIRTGTPSDETPSTTAPAPTPAPSGSGDRPSRGDDSWRRRPSTGSGSTGSSGDSSSTRDSSRDTGSSRGDVPRRVIDRIVVPRDNDSSTSKPRDNGRSSRDSARESRPRDSGSGSSGRSSTRDSGSSSRDSGSSTRDSGSRDSGKSSGSRDSGSKSSGSRDSGGGGRVKRN